MRKHDWADELARQIAADFAGSAAADRAQLELVAVRLRVVRQEGVGEGLDQARNAILTKGKPDAAP